MGTPEQGFLVSRTGVIFTSSGSWVLHHLWQPGYTQNWHVVKEWATQYWLLAKRESDKGNKTQQNRGIININWKIASDTPPPLVLWAQLLTRLHIICKYLKALPSILEGYEPRGAKELHKCVVRSWGSRSWKHNYFLASPVPYNARNLKLNHFPVGQQVNKYRSSSTYIGLTSG